MAPRPFIRDNIHTPDVISVCKEKSSLMQNIVKPTSVKLAFSSRKRVELKAGRLYLVLLIVNRLS